MAAGVNTGGARGDELLVLLVQRLAVDASRFADIFGETHGLHRTDLTALNLVIDATRRDRPLSPTELARALHLSNSATTSVLDRLETAGHTYRDRSTRDRRRIEVHVHPRARELGRAFFAPLSREMSASWAEFSSEQRDTIERFLRASIDAIDRTRANVSPTEQEGNESS